MIHLTQPFSLTFKSKQHSMSSIDMHQPIQKRWSSLPAYRCKGANPFNHPPDPHLPLTYPRKIRLGTLPAGSLNVNIQHSEQELLTNGNDIRPKLWMMLIMTHTANELRALSNPRER